jgi:formimidoylglutamate deiminase
MPDTQVIEADLTLLGSQFERGVQVAIADGRIVRVGKLGLAPSRRLSGQALLPGMINAHSHAFQRGLRGRAETFPQSAGNFWIWRDAMYKLVESLDEGEFTKVCKQAFGEMLAAGITTVGEFHYLHHDESGGGFAFDELVLSAAREVGIRMVLLPTYYKTGGIDKPLSGGQMRFALRSLDEYWARFDKLESTIDPTTQTLGVAAHSIRAVSPDELSELAGESRDRGWVMHMHVEEQPKEILECGERYGKGPLELVVERAEPGPYFTAIHCTHSEQNVLCDYLASGARVCVCPTTEANLGDGLPDARAMWNQNHGSICLGTDSNARIDMVEEMRWLEYGQRLRFQNRGIITDENGGTAGGLWRCATINGAAALNLDAGTITPGNLADFFTVDLSSSGLDGHSDGNLLDMLLFGASTPAAAKVCVNGRWIDVGK